LFKTFKPLAGVALALVAGLANATDISFGGLSALPEMQKAARGRLSSSWSAPEMQKAARGFSADQRSLISLYRTCLRAFGSNFMNSSFSGVVFLFLFVV
jgi:hypothetical protein